jgi:hypothetical protein
LLDFLLNYNFKTKRLQIPKANYWNRCNKEAIICPQDGLTAANASIKEAVNVSAMEGFPIAAELCRNDEYPGTIVYYFEVTNLSTDWW